MGESPAGKDDREVRRTRLGAALRENLKRRKAQARGRIGVASSHQPDSAGEIGAGAEKKDD